MAVDHAGENSTITVTQMLLWVFHNDWATLYSLDEPSEPSSNFRPCFRQAP